MRISRVEQVPGGWSVMVEIPNATTRGDSIEERVFVPADRFIGRTTEERVALVCELLHNQPGDLVGADLTEAVEPPADIAEAELERLFARWQRWHRTREEYERRDPSPRDSTFLNALQAEEDAAWVAYLDGITYWGAARGARGGRSTDASAWRNPR